MKNFTFKKHFALLIAFLGVIGFGYGQNCNVSDEFNRGDNTLIDHNWVEVGSNASIFSNELVINTGGVSGRDYVYQDVSSGYNTQLSSLPSLITWTFNMQQTRPDPTGFGNVRYGVAFVLGGTSSDFTTGDGYAVVLGQSGSIDNVRLVSYTGGLDSNANLTDVITGSADYGNEHLSIKVTYDSSTDTWELFVRNDGGIFADPSTLTVADSQGTVINNLFTASNLDFVGMFWNHATAATEIAKFDNVCINTAITCSSPITTWSAGSWSNGLPDLYTPAEINDDFNTSVGGNQVSFRACSLTINNGAVLTVDNGTFIEVENNVLVNDGHIRLESQGNFVQNDNSGTFTLGASGTAEVAKSTKAFVNPGLHYTYWSSPVESAVIETVFPTPVDNRRFSFNGAAFLDQHTDVVANDLIPDDIDDDGNDWEVATGLMQRGRGYAITSSGPPPFPPYYPYTDQAFFSGVFNTRDIDFTIYRNDTAINDNNWNLVGNPYPSAISSDDFLNLNTYDATTNPTGTIGGVIYLWTHLSSASAANPGNQINNFSQDDYATLNLSGGTAANNGGAIPNRYIPSGQGFFITYAEGASSTGGSAPIFSNTVKFNNGMRRADGTSNMQFFKGSESKSKSDSSNRLWVDLTSDNGVFSQILVAYIVGASKDYDSEAYDAPKNLSSGTAAILYSNIENSDKKFVIQGKAPSDLNENEIIDLGFKTAIDVPTVYTFSIAQFQGAFLNNNPVFLIDNLLNKTHDLKVCDYNFTSEIGEFNKRFQIAFSDKALSTNAMGLNDNALKIFELANDHVNFKLSDNLKIKSVTIFDLLGRQLYNLKGANSSETYQLSKLKNTVYIAKVELSNGAIITKKAIKQ